MKSAHRRELETNVLATRLENYIERYRPYFSKIALGIVALIAILFLWSYVSNSTSRQRDEAWDAYNMAVGTGALPNLDVLRRASEGEPNSSMQRLADTTYADGQVYIASRAFIQNRTAAKDALNKASGYYQGVIQSSDDPRLTGRARLGLARVYELQGDLDKARSTYEEVTGPYATYAKEQAERLSKPEAKETYAWLATAQPPVSKAPMGPGTPGQKPEFSPSDISLPNAAGTEGAAPGETKGPETSFDDLLKGMRDDAKKGETGDRYKTDATPGTGDKSSTDNAPAADSKGADAPAKSDSKSGSGSTPAAPAKDKSAK